RARVAVDQPAPGVRDLEGRIAELLRDAVLELPQGEDRLHEAGRPHRVAAGDQAPTGIDRELARNGRVAFLDEPAALAVTAEAPVLIGLDLRAGVGVVQLDEAEIADRILDPGHAVGLDRRGAAGAEGMDARVLQVPVFLLTLPGQQGNFSVRAIR